MTNLKSAIGQTLAQIDGMNMEWGSSYPIMEAQGDQLVCVGVVDGNWPLEFNNGKWHIVDDRYVMADAPTD